MEPQLDDIVLPQPREKRRRFRVINAPIHNSISPRPRDEELRRRHPQCNDPVGRQITRIESRCFHSLNLKEKEENRKKMEERRWTGEEMFALHRIGRQEPRGVWNKEKQMELDNLAVGVKRSRSTCKTMLWRIKEQAHEESLDANLNRVERMFNSQLEQVDDDWLFEQIDNDFVEHVPPSFPSGHDMAAARLAAAASDQIYLYAFSRTPKEWMEALTKGKLLEDCRQKLELAGYPFILCGSGAKMFVRADQWDAVIKALSMGSSKSNLKSCHVIVADEFEQLLNTTVSQIRSRVRPKVTTRALLNVSAERRVM